MSVWKERHGHKRRGRCEGEDLMMGREGGAFRQSGVRQRPSSGKYGLRAAQTSLVPFLLEGTISIHNFHLAINQQSI